MPHSDTDSTAGVTAAALARIEGAKGRAAKTLPPINACNSLHHYDGECIACPAVERAGATIHADGCPAMQLDAAIRAAGEAG